MPKWGNFAKSGHTDGNLPLPASHEYNLKALVRTWTQFLTDPNTNDNLGTTTYLLATFAGAIDFKTLL